MTLLSRGKHIAAKDSAHNDSAETPAPNGDGKRRLRRPRIAIGNQILVLMVLVALALGVAVGSLLHRGDTLRGTDSGAQRAMYAASTAAQDLSSYDYRTLDSDIKTATAQTTGKLRADYAKQAQAIRATAIQQQVVVNAQTVKSGVESATPDRVVVLVFLNRTTSKAAAGGTAAQARTPDQLRLLMTMDKVGGRWLVSKVDVL